jgi:hypothetical protein
MSACTLLAHLWYLYSPLQEVAVDDHLRPAVLHSFTFFTRFDSIRFYNLHLLVE